MKTTRSFQPTRIASVVPLLLCATLCLLACDPLAGSPNTFWNVEDSFWNVETSGVSTSAGGTGLTDSQMCDISTFLNAGRDFENVWMICEGGDYPRLRWEGLECEAGN
jgi:hypothetical protein